MSTKRTYILTALILIISYSSSFGQRSRTNKLPNKRFDFSLVSGINLSQIDGDYFTGFDQVGLNTGIQVDAILGLRMQLSVGMLFSQKGAKIPHGVIVLVASRNDRNIRLNYIEVPILFRSMLNDKSTGSFLELGGSIARLSSMRIQENNPNFIKGTVYNDITSEFRMTDFNIVVGVGFKVGTRFSTGLRYNYGVNAFYRNPNFELPFAFSGKTKEVEFLRNYNLNLFISYKIF